MKRKSLWLLGLIIIIGALLACGQTTNNTGTAVQDSGASTGNQSSQNSTTTQSNQSQAVTPTAAPAAQHFKVGQTVKVGDTWEVTVNSVKTSQGGDFDQPKAGNTYLLVNVSLKNVSSQEQTVSSLLMFKLRDSTGQDYNETITTGASAPDGKVEAGSPLRGTLAYEVPTSVHSFTLAFEADMLSSGQTIWDIAD